MDDFNIDDYEISERLPKSKIDYDEEEFNLKAKIANHKIRDQAIEELEKESMDLAKTVLAPFAVHGEGFAHFNPYMFSGDFSLVGTVHSHPSGNIRPSHVDLNYFFGRFLMIVGYPFDGEGCIAVYDGEGERMTLNTTPASENQDNEFF